MKKSILAFLVAAVGSIGINQLLNSTNINSINNSKTEVLLNINQDIEVISKLNQEYYSRSEKLNNAMEDNLVANITLNNNEITINYKNLNSNLYSKIIYQMILSSAFVNTLKMQYELKIINFDANNHINFDNPKMTNYNLNVWTEWHWYWFPYWRLHLSATTVTSIIQSVIRLGGISGSTIAAVSKFIATFLNSWITVAVAVAVAAFLIASYAIILKFQNFVNGGWIGIVAIVPGIDWGAN